PVTRISKILVSLAPTALQYSSMSKSKPKKKISRRKFLKGTGAALAVATAAPKIEAQTPAVGVAADAVPRSMIRVTVNGTERRIEPLQQAFIDHDAPQCGFCTSGQLMSAKGLLTRNPQPSADEVRAGMTGNLCRCAGYNHYVEAVLAAATRSASPTGRGGSR